MQPLSLTKGVLLGEQTRSFSHVSEILRHRCDSCWLGSDEPEAHSTEEKPEMPIHSSEEASEEHDLLI